MEAQKIKANLDVIQMKWANFRRKAVLLSVNCTLLFPLVLMGWLFFSTCGRLFPSIWSMCW